MRFIDELLVNLLVLELLNTLFALLHIADFTDAVGVVRVEDAERTLSNAVAMVLGVRWAVRAIVRSILFA